ncbi:MAG: hypothetical protein ACFFB2_20045 [Promethearchaeota archaeon]
MANRNSKDRKEDYTVKKKKYFTPKISIVAVKSEFLYSSGLTQVIIDKNKKLRIEV